jgi:hypothetical protein
MEQELKIKKDGTEEGIRTRDFKERKDDLNKVILDELETLKNYIKTRSQEEQQKLHDLFVENLQTISEFSDSFNNESIQSDDSDSTSDSVSNTSDQDPNKVGRKTSLKYQQDVQDLEKIIKDENDNDNNNKKISLKDLNISDMMKMMSDIKQPGDLSGNPLGNLMNPDNNPLGNQNFMNFLKGVVGEGGFNPDLMKKSLKESFDKLIDTPQLSNMVKALGKSSKLKEMKSQLKKQMAMPDLTQLISQLNKAKAPAILNKSASSPNTLNNSKIINKMTPPVQQLNVKKEQEFEKNRQDTEKTKIPKIMVPDKPKHMFRPVPFSPNTSNRFGSFLHAFGHGRIKNNGRLLII